MLLIIIVYFLTRDSGRKVRLAVGILLWVLVLSAFGLGANYLQKGMRTLDEITKNSVELTDICIYVKQQDTVIELNDMQEYTFGILKELERKNTDKAVEEICVLIGDDLNIVEYDTLPELISGFLVEETTDAIIINSAFMDIISEIEGYDTIAKLLREIYSLQVENIIIEEQKENITPQEEISLKESSEGKTFSLYISGIDSKKGLVAKSRSDVNIIATVNTQTRQILLVSTPRDYYVPLSISNGMPDKLTHAGIYGINVSMDTLEMLYNMEIDYYFRVNFIGFEKIIDALDGITVISDYAFQPIDLEGAYFTKGENYLNGEEALAFARERHAFKEGDRQRGKNQMAVIEAVVDKALSPTLLKNYSDIMESLAGSFETNVPYDVIAELVREQLSEGGDWDIVSYSVDGAGASEKTYSMGTNAYVMVPDYDTVNTAIEMMEQVRTGQLE